MVYELLISDLRWVVAACSGKPQYIFAASESTSTTMDVGEAPFYLRVF